VKPISSASAMMPSFLTNYIKFLPLPKTGPHILSVTFLTPFARLTQSSSNYVGNYSAQQARLDHLGQEEIVEIIVENPADPFLWRVHFFALELRSSSPPDFTPRSSLFWKDFTFRSMTAISRSRPPTLTAMQPQLRASRPLRHDGCYAQIRVPRRCVYLGLRHHPHRSPEGDPVSVEFDLTRLR